MSSNPLWSASAAIVLISGFAFADVAEKNFSLQTTRDLYELCSAPTDHQDYAPAIYSCRSFLEATVQYHDAVSDGKTLKRLDLLPVRRDARGRPRRIRRLGQGQCTQQGVHGRDAGHGRRAGARRQVSLQGLTQRGEET